MKSSLNSQQLLCVSHENGPLMILAGAGTGKTKVITHRIQRLIGKGSHAHSIVALTFTNKAAKEMRERLSSLVGPESRKVFCGTFHSYCLKLLRRHHEAVGLVQKFSLIDTHDQVELIKKALDHKGWSNLYRADEIQSRISMAKNALLSPEDFQFTSKVTALQDPDPKLLAVIYELYERQLKLNCAIDFDDCIRLAVKLLGENDAKRLELQSEISNLLVDEFQDTNFAQLTLIGLITSKEENICVVGDDDQSIYSWRGAMIETMLRFQSMYPSLKVIKLEQNYRCSNVILDAANCIIKNNPQRIDKTLWSASKIADPIVLAELEDDQAESRWIASKCFALLGKGYSPSDICILFRTNGQARKLEEAFREFQLEYKVIGGSSFFERKEVRDFLSFMRIICDQKNRLSFYRTINTPQRGIGIKTIEAISDLAMQKGISLFEVLEATPSPFKGQISQVLLDFSKKVRLLASLPTNTPQSIEELSWRIIKDFGLDNDIRTRVVDAKARTWKLDLLYRLPSWIKSLAEYRLTADEELSLLSLLDALTLSDEKEKSGEEKAITLMTIHASKGLEWPIVFVAGAEEELIPHRNSIDSPLCISEERRLMYVALTRAKEKLFISYAKERALGFKREDRKISRFINEIPDCRLSIEHSLLTSSPKEERREGNLKKLSNLQQMIRSGFTSSPHQS